MIAVGMEDSLQQFHLEDPASLYGKKNMSIDYDIVSSSIETSKTKKRKKTP